MGYTDQYTTNEPTRAELEALEDRTVLEFGAPWCPHCQAVQADLGRLLAEHAGIRHFKIEDGKGRALGRSFAVKLWPNLVFIRNGQVVAQLARPDRAELEAAFAEFTPVS